MHRVHRLSVIYIGVNFWLPLYFSDIVVIEDLLDIACIGEGTNKTQNLHPSVYVVDCHFISLGASCEGD